MKKLIFIIVLVLQTAFAHSQINKGQWLVGGNLLGMYQNSNYSGNNTYSNFTFQVSPDIGYFICNQLALGIRGIASESLSIYEFNNSSTDKILTTTLNIGPYLRYYFYPNIEKINFFADVAYEYGNSQFQYIYTTNTNIFSSKSNNFNVRIGPAYFLNPNTSLMIIMEYQYTKYVDNSISRNSISVGVGFQIHLGKKNNDQPKYNTTK